MENVEIKESRAYIDVEAVLMAIDKLGVRNLIWPIRNIYSDLLTAMVVARILWPDSKFHLSHNWRLFSLSEALHINNATENDLYDAVDWFYEQRLEVVESGLINWHKESIDSAVFYISQCPFIMDRYLETQLGDQVEVKRSINYGVLVDGAGRPIHVYFFKGDKLNTKAILSAIDGLQKQYRLPSFLLVTDENILSQTQFKILKQKVEAGADISWVAALKMRDFKELVDSKILSLSSLSETRLLRVEHTDFDNEKLVFWKNPKLAERWQEDRRFLLKIATDELNKIQRKVTKGLLNNDKKIIRLADQVINKYKMTRYISHKMDGDQFQYSVDQAKVDGDKAFDGLSMIRVFSNDALSVETVKRHYMRQQLSRESFQAIRIMDIEGFSDSPKQRQRIKTYLFICLLANYVKWHMLEHGNH